MKYTKALLLILLISLGSAGVSQGAELPSYYPETVPAMNGIIGYADIKQGVIVINDMSWKLSMNVRVHSLNTQFSSVRALRSGMRIAFESTSINGKVQLAEIWVLPKDYEY